MHGEVVELSVVVPCYNEAPVLDRLFESLSDVLSSLTRNFEVLLIDDGSDDGTLQGMRAISGRDPRFRYLALSRNFGKESAMLAGLSQARGRAVAIMDADLQHPPALLLKMLPLLPWPRWSTLRRQIRRIAGVWTILGMYFLFTLAPSTPWLPTANFGSSGSAPI